ncbi:MAG: thiamine pyrophosphate-dependent enzyme [Bacillota bacterium]
MTLDISKYLRKLPHIWCAGCGNGIVVGAMLRGLEQLGIDQTQVAVISGIGCSGRAGNYLNLCGFQPTHGRALAFATGVKLGNPNLKVIVLAGDGDSLSIGGNHFIHACRRNIDLTMLVFNNGAYGMTGGQHAPTTPGGFKTTTTPYGNVEPNFDTAELARVSGATYVARSSIYHVQQLISYISRGISHRGFAVVEAMSTCPTQFGRMNKLGGPVEMMKSLAQNAVPVKDAAKMAPIELAGKFITGELHVNKETPEYTERVQQVIAMAQQRREKA